jgi:hypothetical protein
MASMVLVDSTLESLTLRVNASKAQVHIFFIIHIVDRH